MTATVPPASIPLGFLLASGFGLVAFGVAIAVVARRAVTGPTALPVVSAVHFGMLAFLSTAVLGALHQFVPVITTLELRSIKAARATLAGWLLGAWLLPVGFAFNATPLIVIGGSIAVLFAFLAAWNLSGPLMKSSTADPVVGLRSSVSYLAITVSFGIVYAIDLHHGWFGLLPNRVLAHAELGLLGWVGLSYVSVAEKLWPMFLLSHKEKRGMGQFSVRLLPAGVLLLGTGLLFSVKWLGVLGGILAVAGLAAHVASFVGWVRHRRRKLELLHAFVVASMAFLVTAVLTGATAGLASVSLVWRTRLAVTAVASTFLWVAVAIIGHAHKIVPFITWTTLRADGISKKVDGKPILFGDLYSASVARAAFGCSVAAGVALIAGAISGTPVLISVAGGLLAISGAIVTANLALWPKKIRNSAAASTSPEPGTPAIGKETSHE